MGGQGDQSWQAAYHQEEVAALTKHLALQPSMVSSVGLLASSGIRARINADMKRAVERNNARMVKELNSIREANPGHVIVLVPDSSGELEPCLAADQVTGTRNVQRDMYTPSVGSCSTWTVDHATPSLDSVHDGDKAMT